MKNVKTETQAFMPIPVATKLCGKKHKTSEYNQPTQVSNGCTTFVLSWVLGPMLFLFYGSRNVFELF